MWRLKAVITLVHVNTDNRNFLKMNKLYFLIIYYTVQMPVSWQVVCTRLFFFFGGGGLSCDRSQRPSARGGRPGRSHGDGTDLHGPQERRETRQNLPDHHQVGQSQRHVQPCLPRRSLT